MEVVVLKCYTRKQGAKGLHEGAKGALAGVEAVADRVYLKPYLADIFGCLADISVVGPYLADISVEGALSC